MPNVNADSSVPKPAYVTIAPKFLKKDLFFMANPAWKTIGGRKAKKNAEGENLNGFESPKILAPMPATIPKSMAQLLGGIQWSLNVTVCSVDQLAREPKTE